MSKALSEQAMAHQREYQRWYRAKKKAERAAKGVPPARNGRPPYPPEPEYIPRQYYRESINSIEYWGQLQTLMATHKNWTVAKCKAKIAQGLRERTTQHI